MFASEIYGTAPTFIPAVNPPDTALSATDSVRAGWRAMVDPKNPLVWFGAILLVTVGAAGVAGSVKLGPAAVGGKLGRA